MTEFTQGIQGAFQKILTSSSLGLALIYTFGHIIKTTTICVVRIIASIKQHLSNIITNVQLSQNSDTNTYILQAYCLYMQHIITAVTLI